MGAAEDHLLRTLAWVAPGTRVIEVGCGAGDTTAQLVALGLDVRASDADVSAVNRCRTRLAGVAGPASDERVRLCTPWALPDPDGLAGWGVVSRMPADPDVWPALFAELARVVAPGGWIWVRGGRATGAAAREAGLLLAEVPTADGPDAHVVYRRPDAAT